jgi:hypothetical protein
MSTDTKTATTGGGKLIIPTQKTGNTSVDSLNFPQLPGSGSTDSNWAAAAKASYDVTGLGLPNTPANGQMTGDQIYQAFNAMAASNDKNWSGIRDILKNTIPGYTAKDLKLNWTNQDVTATRDFITTLHNYNVTYPTKQMGITAFLNTTAKQAQKSGVSFNTLNSTQTTAPIITLPSQADLADTAQKAFATTLGRSASPAEVEDFAKKYQDLVLSYGNAKVDAKKNAAFNAPANPIQFDQTGQTPQPIVNPVAATNAIEQPPTASLAAANYAAKQNPTEASAQAAADGLNQFMSMLKGA